MSRPAGVTILAVLAILGGGFALGLGFMFLLGSSYLVRLTGMPNFIASIAAFVAFAGISIGILDLAIGYGFLMLANWARILGMICVALSLAGTCLGILQALLRFGYPPLPRQIVMMVVDVLILWYLSRPHVKRAFSRQPEPPMASGTPAASA